MLGRVTTYGTNFWTTCAASSLGAGAVGAEEGTDAETLTMTELDDVVGFGGVERLQVIPLSAIKALVPMFVVLF